ncbi:MAG: LysR family transcriptional regulator [Pseudomonadota bacterium]|nr:LysR family transcriptional regulator [Pseudomonadota bacterium]
MDKLQSMAVFVQIAEQGSLTAAAEAMNKSLPSVVRILAALEESLQVRLFNRTTRRIALTEEGRLYLEQCCKILADVQEAERSLSQIQAEPSGQITVTAPVRFGEMHVASSVARFLDRYPKTRVNLLLLDRVVDLLEEGVDIAVRIAHLADSSLIAKPIGAILQVVCAGPGLLDRVGEPVCPEALSDLPCVHFTGISASPEWEFMDGEKRLTVPIKSVLTCNQVGASIEACASDVGFGRFLCYQVAPLIRTGKLVRVLADYEPPPMPLSLVYPHTRLLSSRVRAMVDWLADDIGQSLDGTSW